MQLKKVLLIFLEEKNTGKNECDCLRFAFYLSLANFSLIPMTELLYVRKDYV